MSAGDRMDSALSAYRRERDRQAGKLETVTGTGRACWASYLINGDESGIDPADVLEADAFVAWLGACPVDCGAESYFATPDAPAGALPGDCVDYVALIDPAAGDRWAGPLET